MTRRAHIRPVRLPERSRGTVRAKYTAPRQPAPSIAGNRLWRKRLRRLAKAATDAIVSLGRVLWDALAPLVDMVTPLVAAVVDVASSLDLTALFATQPAAPAD